MTFLFFIVETQSRFEDYISPYHFDRPLLFEINTGLFVPVRLYSCRKGGGIDGTDQRI